MASVHLCGGPWAGGFRVEALTVYRAEGLGFKRLRV